MSHFSGCAAICGDIYGSQAKKSIQYIANSLKLSPGTDDISYVADALVQVAISVPADGSAHYKYSGHCFGSSDCAGSITITGVLAVSVTTTCDRCPVPQPDWPGVGPPVVSYQASVTWYVVCRRAGGRAGGWAGVLCFIYQNYQIKTSTFVLYMHDIYIYIYIYIVFMLTFLRTRTHHYDSSL